MEQKYDVFISYSSQDQKMTEGICGYLEARGIRCFVAYRDIPPGVVWAGCIADAIDQSRIMVVVFSRHFNNSPQTDREIELASENRLPILTYRIANEQLTGAKKYFLKNLNWIDAFPDADKCFGILYENVSKLLDLQSTQPVTEKDTKATGIFPDFNKVVSKRLVEEKERQQKEKRKKEEDAKRKAQAEEWAKLGHDYYYGRNGKSIDYAEAVKWYRKAAEQGNADAQNGLGRCYNDGKGITQDYIEAWKWFRKAEEQGKPEWG